jgi:CDP-glucose 4,6-dehydratase
VHGRIPSRPDGYTETLLAVSVDPAFWSRRRVLLTGHTGFKGAWLSLWLQHLGADVVGLAPGPPTQPSLYDAAAVAAGMSQRAVDVRDAAAVLRAMRDVRPEVVMHLAAQPMVRRALREPRDTYEINVMGTVNVLDAVRLAPGVRAVLVVTSDKCYENPDHGRRRHAFVEADPMGGSDPYSSSKGAAELVTAAYRSSYFDGRDEEGPRVASVRAGNVIGGGDWGEDRLVPDVIRAAHSGDVVRLRNPDAVRPWQHVLSPLSGYLLLAQALAADARFGGAWNFGPPENDVAPVRHVVGLLAELWPQGLRWEPDETAQPPEASYLALDSGKARRELGWQPPWDLEQAVRSIVEWHVAHDRGQDMRAASLAQIEQFGL